MIEMKVNGLAIDSTSKMPVVILTDQEEKRFLPIWIGVYEADAILVALEDIKVPRPMTHDLRRNRLETLHITVDRVVIHDIKNNTFFARLLVEQNGTVLEVDSRPSDAIALAVHVGCPIFVAEEVLDEVAIQPQ